MPVAMVLRRLTAEKVAKKKAAIFSLLNMRMTYVVLMMCSRLANVASMLTFRIAGGFLLWPDVQMLF